MPCVGSISSTISHYFCGFGSRQYDQPKDSTKDQDATAKASSNSQHQPNTGEIPFCTSLKCKIEQAIEPDEGQVPLSPRHIVNQSMSMPRMQVQDSLHEVKTESDRKEINPDTGKKSFQKLGSVNI